MLKTKFEAKQYLIKQSEIKLKIETQSLLTEMLRNISKEDLEKLEGYNLTGDEYSDYIKTIIITNSDITFIIKDYENHIYRYGIERFDQSVQKDLVDYILDNFKFI